MGSGQQKTVKFPDGRVVTFHSKEAADLARMMAQPAKRKPYAAACGCLRVCRSKKTGRFVKSRKGKRK